MEGGSSCLRVRSRPEPWKRSGALGIRPVDLGGGGVPVASPRRCDCVRIHRRPNLLAIHIAERKAIPVTKPVRTAIDLAPRLGAGPLERMINEADRLGLFSPEGLLGALDDYPGVRGVGPLRSTLGARIFRLTDSELERRFLRIVERAHLPYPLTRQDVAGFRVDFFWPDLGLVVETDGLTYHRTPRGRHAIACATRPISPRA